MKSPDGSEVTLPAGMYTVRNVAAAERKSKAAKPQALTVEQLLEAAKAENYTLPKKLLDLIARFQSQQSQPAPTPKNENTDTDAA